MAHEIFGASCEHSLSKWKFIHISACCEKIKEVFGMWPLLTMKYSILRSYENFHFGLSLDEIEIEIVTCTL